MGDCFLGAGLFYLPAYPPDLARSNKCLLKALLRKAAARSIEPSEDRTPLPKVPGMTVSLVVRRHGVVRWRRIDLAQVIEKRYGVKLAERSVRPGEFVGGVRYKAWDEPI